MKLGLWLEVGIRVWDSWCFYLMSGCNSITQFNFLACVFAAMLVNDELLQRLTNGKANLNKPLVIHRSTETSVPLDYHSPSEEVVDWLRGKGFSET